MKTIREWLSELPEPYRSKAVLNTSKRILNSKSRTLGETLISAFSWEATTDGYEYWNDLWRRETSKDRKRKTDAPSFSSPSPHRLFEQIAEYVDKHDLKTYKILVTDGVAELITED